MQTSFWYICCMCVPRDRTRCPGPQIDAGTGPRPRVRALDPQKQNETLSHRQVHLINGQLFVGSLGVVWFALVGCVKWLLFGSPLHIPVVSM